MIFKCVSLTVFLFVAKGVIAQEPSFKNYSSENGFPSSLGFCIVQDSSGFIWVCTNNGLCRFDGRHVKTFVPQNSPTDYGTFHLYLDKSQRLWVISNSSPPVYYRDGAFHELDNPLKEELADNRWICEDSRGRIYFLTHNGTIVKWDGTAKYEKGINMPGYLSGGQLVNDSTMVVTGHTSFGNLFRITNLATVTVMPVRTHKYDYNRFFKIRDNLVIGASGDGLYQYTENGQKLIWSDGGRKTKVFYCLHVENDSTFWMGCRDGVYVFEYHHEKLQLIKKMLGGKDVLSIIKDRSGNHWISTTEDGLYFLNSVNAVSYNLEKESNHVADILCSGDEIYVLNTKGDLFLLRDNGLTYLYNITARKPNLIFLKAGQLTADSALIYFRADSVGILTKGKLSLIDNPFRLSTITHYLRRDGALFIKGGASDNTCQVHRVIGKKEELTQVLPAYLHYKTVFCVDLDSRSWLGKKDTLYAIGDKNDPDQRLEKFFEKNVYISDLQCDGRNQVWAATRGNGVYCYRNRKRVLHYNIADGLLSNNCTAIYIDGSNDVWVCSANGLNLLQHCGNGQYIVRSYTTDNLLPDNCINSVCQRGPRIYIGTNKGLVVFEKKDMPEIMRLPVACYISNIAINGRDTAVQNNYQMKFGGSVSISFSAIAFNMEQPPVYHYTLNEADGDWNKTTSEKIQYEHLAPGAYTFVVYVDGWPEKKTRLTFTVLTPWWRKLWFVAIETLGVIAILVGCVYGYLYYRNRQSEFRRKMIENDLKSLRAQINPHFIFNALNSIQDFILNHQPRPANHFLTQFSRLIRLIVDNSGREYISLKDEIDFIKLYLELERLRLGNSFSFEISYDAGIDPVDIAIPAMIVQPVVENSLLHGLAMKNGSKQLSLHFSVSGSMLQCVVTDNGIGRKNAQIYEKKKQSISMGLNNITERLQLVCIKENVKWHPIEIADATDDNEAPGTIVTLYMPLMNTH